MFKWSHSDIIALPLTLLIIIAIGVLLRFILIKKNDKIKSLPLKLVGCCLLALEIAKQIYYIFIKDSYPLYALPVHFCALTMIMILFSQFLPKKAANFFKAPAFIYSLLTGILIYVNPYAVIGDSSENLFKGFTFFHSYSFHFLILAYAIFTICLNDYIPKKKDCISMFAAITFYCCYAVPISFSLNINYVNILYSFFEPLEQLRLACGQVVYDVVLFLITGTATSLLVLIYYWIYNKVNKKKWINYNEQ